MSNFTKPFKKSTLCQAVGLVSLVLATPAFANDGETVNLGTLTATFEDVNRYAVPKSDGSAGLSLSVRETPQMVSVLNQARISDQNLQTMKEVLDNTSGINVTNIDGGRLSFSSRGFNIEQFSADGADMDFNAQMSVGETLVGTDIYEKIEVTHGATGLVTGSGEPSARVNMVRKKANSPKRSTSVSVNANRFGNYGVSFDHNQALTQSGAVRGRVVLNHQDGETFIDNEERGRSSAYVTVQADLGASTVLDVGAVYRTNKQEGVMWGGLPTYFNDGTRTNWDASKNNSANWTKWNNKTQEYFANLTHNFNDDWQATIKAYHLNTEGDPKLLYHSYNVIEKATGLPVARDPLWAYNAYKANNTTKQSFFSADVKGNFELFGQAHQATLGVSHHTDERDAYSVSVGNKAEDIISLYDWTGKYAEPVWSIMPTSPQAEVKATEKSVYGALQLRLADPLSVIVGARVSDYDKKGVQWGRNVTSKAEKAVTPYAGVIFDIDDSQSLYASYTSIYKPQERRTVSGDYLDAEQGNTYEVGYKSSSADGKLQGQVTFFHTQKDNLAQALENTYVAGTENSSKEQAYTTTDGNTSTGVEMEVSGKLSPHWQAMASFTTFDAKDKDNKRINTTSSDRMIKLWTIYDLSRFVDGLSVGGGVNWYDQRYALLTNPVTNMQEKYGQDDIFLVNLMARYKFNPHLEAQLNLSNVLDEKYFSGSGFNQITNGEPMNVSGSLTYRF